MPTLVVPPNYGYVLLIALGLTPILSTYHGVVVTRKRKPAGVTYPNCYATPEQMKDNKEAYAFNCAQRAHANFLENAPWAVMTMLVAGQTYPMATAACSLGWLVARFAFMYGYVFSEKPDGKGRSMGFTFWPLQGLLWGMSVITAIRLI